MLIIGSLESREIIKKKEKKPLVILHPVVITTKFLIFFLSKHKKALIYIFKRVLFLRVVLFDMYACTPTMLLKTFLDSGPI